MTIAKIVGLKRNQKFKEGQTIRFEVPLRPGKDWGTAEISCTVTQIKNRDDFIVENSLGKLVHVTSNKDGYHSMDLVN